MKSSKALCRSVIEYISNPFAITICRNIRKLNVKMRLQSCERGAIKDAEQRKLHHMKGNAMNLDDLTIGQAKQLAAQYVAFQNGPSNPACEPVGHDRIPVLVCTDKRGVVFGYTYDQNARPITLETARMALYWSSDVGGVFGLADIGPTKDCKISAVVPKIALEGVTAVFAVDAKAEKAWSAAKVQGR